MVQRTTRPPRMGMAAVAGGLVALVAIALIVGPCNDDDDHDPPDRAGTSSQPTNDSTATTLSPEEEVEAAYLAYWDMAVRLAQAPNPDDPEISERASGDARAKLVDGLTTLRAMNHRSEFGPQYRHEVLTVEVNNGEAVLQDCTVDDSRIVDAANGRTVVEGIGTELLSVTLLHDGSRWLVDRFQQTESWEGAVDCV